uniref:Group II intron reverse transcriptase/maturase n=1 Tax=Candidatus Kentrum sp. LFY TaxID=2126342 RepID=A0A450X6I7_9GAMM|nr:MAG: group II intron reverse transcriptase/maturase [Candidatus Kentron sp. LFY]
MAIERVLDLWQQGYKVVLDADIQGFFDNIPHSVVMAGLRRVVADGNILGLVERFLRAGVMDNGVFKPTTVGTPQGGVFSPLLANIALNSLDWWLDEHGLRFVRYADDFVVLCSNHAQAEEAMTLVRHHLENELNLNLSPEKTHIATFSKGFEFLGFRISSYSRTMRGKSVENFGIQYPGKIREITKRSHNLDDALIVQVNRVVRGTANYFATAFSHNRSLFRRLDRWIRMRMRCMKFNRKWTSDNRVHPTKAYFVSWRPLIFNLRKSISRNP